MSKKSEDTVGIILGLCQLFLGVGYIINFQNLFEYVVGSAPWTWSLIGAFLAPVGCFTGWIY